MWLVTTSWQSACGSRHAVGLTVPSLPDQIDGTRTPFGGGALSPTRNFAQAS